MNKFWRTIVRILEGAIQPKILEAIGKLAIVLFIMVILGLASPTAAVGIITALLKLYFNFILPDWFKFLFLAGGIIVVLGVVIAAVAYIINERNNTYF